MFLLRIEAEIRPTEDEDKVRKAIMNILDIKSSDIKAVEEGNGFKRIIAETKDITSLFKLYELIRQDRILDAVRSVMMKSRSGNVLSIKIHKQSAYAGHISLVTYDEESPLGPIILTIMSDSLDEIIDWLAPKTSRGKPLWEKPVPKVDP